MTSESKFSYRTIANESTAKFTDKNSRFLAYAKSVYTENDAQVYLNLIQQEHIKASHHCYAFRLGLTGNLFRANDDGEPSNSAGKPILGQIDSFELTNIMIIVVRYYGGVNLGVSGLIQAYKKTAQVALEKSTIIQKYEQATLSFQIKYAYVNDFQQWVNNVKAELIQEKYTDNSGLYQIQFPKYKTNMIKNHLKEFQAEYLPNI